MKFDVKKDVENMTDLSYETCQKTGIDHHMKAYRLHKKQENIQMDSIYKYKPVGIISRYDGGYGLRVDWIIYDVGPFMQPHECEIISYGNEKSYVKACITMGNEMERIITSKKASKII